MLHRILSTPISSNLSLVAIRDRSRQVGELFGLDNLQRTRFITAISEIARNAVQFAGGGTLTFLVGDASEAIDTQCVVAQISDKGPGIANVERLLNDSSHRADDVGVGIPGSRRMADGFFIKSEPGVGTTVTLEMFLPRDAARLTASQLSERVDQLTLRKAQTPVEELEKQNRDMLLALEELRRKRTELEEADARKNEFLAMLAHELRNPLAAITLSLEVARRNGEQREEAREKTYAVIGRQANGQRFARRFPAHARQGGTADGSGAHRYVDRWRDRDDVGGTGAAWSPNRGRLSAPACPRPGRRREAEAGVQQHHSQRGPVLTTARRNPRAGVGG
jgi:anti-sigma regulatory factor (Ser/Thr protein kinase)